MCAGGSVRGGLRAASSQLMLAPTAAPPSYAMKQRSARLVLVIRHDDTVRALLLSLPLCACCRWRELAKTKYAAWQQDSKRRVAVADTLKQQIDGLLQTCQWHAGSLPPELFSGNGSMQAEGAGLQDKQHSWQELVQQQWGALFDRAAHLDKPGEVPSHLLCPLTMEVSPCLPPGRLVCVFCG